MDNNPKNLEQFIFYLSYAKASVKAMGKHIESFINAGVLDDAEAALVDSILIGLAKTDGEFDQTLEQCVQRTDKADHIALALHRVLKEGVSQ